MTVPKIKHVRASVMRGTEAGGGGDYHDQKGGHWIDDHIATPMAKYPAYRASRQSFGIHLLGSLVIEIEADDGTTGFAVTTGGEPGAWIVENHLARFVEGAAITDLERIWDQMYLSTLYYGRKGLVLNAISGVDLALWDLLGQWRQEPVYQLLGGKVRDELVFYATGARPDAGPEARVHRRQAAAAPWPGRGRRGAAARISRLLADMREPGRPGFLADVRLLDEPRPRLRDPAGDAGLGTVRAEMDRGGAAAG